MSEDGVYPVGQEELPGACRCVDGWQGHVKDQYIHCGREVVVSFLPQEAGEMDTLCDSDWHAMSVAFFSRGVAHDDRAVRAHLLQSVGLLFDHQLGRLGVKFPVINYTFRFGQYGGALVQWLLFYVGDCVLGDGMWLPWQVRQCFRDWAGVVGLLHRFGVVARNRLKINVREGLYNLRDGTSHCAMFSGPHGEMLSDLLGGVDQECPGGSFGFESLDEVDSGLCRLFYLNSASGVDVVAQVRYWVWGRLSNGPSYLPGVRVLSYGLAGAFGVNVRCVRHSEGGEVVEFMIDDVVRWSYGASQGFSWDFYMS